MTTVKEYHFDIFLVVSCVSGQIVFFFLFFCDMISAVEVNAMNTELEIFETACRETLYRWQDTPGQEQKAEENVKYAIIFALNDNNYRGFTNRGNARQNVIQLGKENIECALFYNMIQLSDYFHRRNDQLDGYMQAVNNYCNASNISDLEEVFHTGLKLMTDEERLLQQYHITDPEQKKIQRDRMREGRKRNDASSQVAYDYANSIITNYVWYNTKYQMVTSNRPIQNFYDRSSGNNLLNYYQTKKQGIPNIQR